MTRAHANVAELTFKDKLAYALAIAALVLASFVGFAGTAKADEGSGQGGAEVIEVEAPEVNLGSGVSGNGEEAIEAEEPEEPEDNPGSGVSGNGEVADEVEEADEVEMPDINLGSGVSGNGEVMAAAADMTAPADMHTPLVLTKDETKVDAQFDDGEVDFTIETKLEAVTSDPHKLAKEVLARFMLSKDEIMSALKVEDDIVIDEVDDVDEILPETAIESKVVIDKAAGTAEVEAKLTFEAMAATPEEAVNSIFMKLSVLTVHDIFSVTDITIK